VRRSLSVVAVLGLLAVVAAACVMPPPPAPGPVPTFGFIGRYSIGLGDGSGEIAAIDGDLMVVTNSEDNSLDFVDVSDPGAPAPIQRKSLVDYGSGPNSAAVSGDPVLVIVDGLVPGGNGRLVVFDRIGRFIGDAEVGATPDMVAVSENGKRVVIANEGEPTSYGQPDSVGPEGTFSVVNIAGPYAIAAGDAPSQPGWTGTPQVQANTSTVSFADFNVGGPRAAELPADVRVFGPGASVAQDLEPEYVAFTGNAYDVVVTLQENNAVALVDVNALSVVNIRPLGSVDHSLVGQGIDASDKDNTINIANWPVRGLRQPDANASFRSGGQVHDITANEGDAREYSGFAEEVRVGNGAVTLNPVTFPNAATLKNNANLGRLNITNTSPKNGSGQYVELNSFGTRSFSIFREDGTLVTDSGDDFEQITAALLPENFNASNNSATFDDRSDNKGPEPEGVATGLVDGNQLAFVGLERVGGVMVYNVTNPANLQFLQYLNTRDFTVAAGPDAGPEGVSFVPADRSPTAAPLVSVSHEISGTVVFYGPIDPDGAGDLTLLHNNDGESVRKPQIATSGGTSLPVGGVAASATVADRERRDGYAKGNSGLNVLRRRRLPGLGRSGVRAAAGAGDHAGLRRGGPAPDRLRRAHHREPRVRLQPGFPGFFIKGFRTKGRLTQPFLSANLDFSGEPGFASLLDPDGLLTGTTVGDQVVAKSKIVNDRVTGGRFGVVGAATPLLPTISTPRNVTVTPDLASTAATVQTEIDRLRDT